jgi:predicted PurR-regulated permease PerM
MNINPSSQLNNWTFRRVMWATLVLVFVTLAFWLLYRFYDVIFILLIAIITGTAIRPIVSWLYRKGLPQVAGVLLVYLLVLVLLISFGLLLFPLIVKQATAIVAAVPGYYQSLRTWMFINPNQLIVSLGDFLPSTLPGLEPLQQTGEQVLATAEQALGYVAFTARVIFIVTAFLLLAYHWTLNGPRTIQSLMRLIPKGHRKSLGDLISAMEAKVGFYIAGQGMLCLVIGIMALVAYLLIGLPNALVLALVAGLLEAIPMVGPLLGAIPAAIIAFSLSPVKLIWVIVATLVIQQLENSILVPRVMRKAMGVNPFVSLLAIFTFSSMFGIAGAFMAIPMAAIIQLILDRFVFHPSSMESEVSTGRDYTSRLRYEAQDLAEDLRRQARIKQGGSVLRVKQVDKVMDEIETITTDLDALLSQIPPTGAP